MTGTGLRWTTARLTLPRRKERSGPRPRDPITTRSCPAASIRRRISSAALSVPDDRANGNALGHARGRSLEQRFRVLLALWRQQPGDVGAADGRRMGRLDDVQEHQPGAAAPCHRDRPLERLRRVYGPVDRDEDAGYAVWSIAFIAHAPRAARSARRGSRLRPPTSRPPRRRA